MVYGLWYGRNNKNRTVIHGFRGPAEEQALSLLLNTAGKLKCTGFGNHSVQDEGASVMLRDGSVRPTLSLLVL